ncbi:EndoU domain-containing protein [Ramlibacter sp. AN1015]|uniref:EndoU domain-containing protein n=1 Tax=Ramlibacter sp. AN1015 TaxID=3133428 RepID=UPI00404081C3
MAGGGPARRGHRRQARRAHLWPGAPGKTPFPRSWDADRILEIVSDIATDPSLQAVQQPNGRLRITGVRDSVEILVITEPPGVRNGRIVTAYPVKQPKDW